MIFVRNMFPIAIILVVVAASVVSAPQGNDLKKGEASEIPKTTQAPVEEGAGNAEDPDHNERVDIVLQTSRLPSSPINVTESAKMCAKCGEGPQLACPRDGDCGNDDVCCYDKCRERQVCRPKSDVLDNKIKAGEKP